MLRKGESGWVSIFRFCRVDHEGWGLAVLFCPVPLPSTRFLARSDGDRNGDRCCSILSRVLLDSGTPLPIARLVLCGVSAAAAGTEARGVPTAERYAVRGVAVLSRVVGVCTALVSSGCTCVGRTKTPYCGSHAKYRLPCTDPSFFPRGSSRWMPTQVPGAKDVWPTNSTSPHPIFVTLHRIWSRSGVTVDMGTRRNNQGATQAPNGVLVRCIAS